MTNDQKIIKNKLGLLKLGETLGNVNQACHIMGYSRDSFYRFKELYDEGGEAALDSWLEHYNAERPHTGKYCLGRTPFQTWLEAKHLVREKMLDKLFEGESDKSQQHTISLVS